ncbi:MAG: cellulase family glycosylhydrolase, partial [Nanoarchaeota archaeon]|nr:cellulase family glycosylhydrolase [Nanoarchaeota archaeon]
CDSDEVPPCVDANSNGICDEEEMPPCPDANNNNICDTEEIPPCPDVNENGICDTDEIPDNNTTLQITPENYKVAFIGDSGHGNNFRQVLQLIRDEEADMVIHAGDLGYDESNAQSPQLWLDQIESVLDPTASERIFPYFFSMGNHDVSHWNDATGYHSILEDRFNRLEVTYTGDPLFLGAKTGFVYNGIAVTLTAPGERRDVAGENHAAFIEQQFQDNEQLWDLCVWHKNQRAMQVGGKGDEAGWAVYETCREQGAIIATGHEHSYGRTHVLSDMVNQDIVDMTSPYTIEPGQTFAFHSGLGGTSVRGQRSDIEELDYFASVYTSNQAADRNTAYGALFIEFNIDNEPRKARGYFKNIAGEIIDDFEIYNNTPEPTIEEPVIPPAAEFVSAQGTELRLDGEQYTFIGFNDYGLANDDVIFACGPSVNHGENPDEYLNDLFSTLSSNGVNAMRFWAFQSYTNGGTNFSSFDRVIQYANQYNIKLIPTLENHWKDCTQGDIAGEEKSSAWYATGYTQPYGNYALSYRQYVRAIVTRYQNEPAILMWQLMNEAESQDADALYNFTADMSGLIKSIDQNHLVSLGTLGTGQAGTANEHFVRLHSLNTIDVVEAHDYNRETQAWPSGGSNSINRAFTVAQSLNKPFFIGEAGINVGNERTFQQRADLFDAKIGAAFDRGVVGYLIWKWEDGCSSGNCVMEGDPVLDVIERYSQ